MRLRRLSRGACPAIDGGRPQPLTGSAEVERPGDLEAVVEDGDEAVGGVGDGPVRPAPYQAEELPQAQVRGGEEVRQVVPRYLDLVPPGGAPGVGGLLGEADP